VDQAAIRGEALRLVLGGKALLSGVDISIRRGEVFGVLGANGAGKTSLLRVLAGDLPPVSGKVWLFGVDVTRMPLWERARRGLGYVPQGPSVLFDLTVSDNIRTFERAAASSPRSKAVPVAERASTVGLDNRLDVRARDLSGGERRRLEILRGLISDPLVLICDEPFSGGDPAHVRSLSSLLRAHADRGRAVLLADHRVAEALGICDEAILMVDGRALHVGEASAFTEHPAVKGRYLG
jgi:lipopolysaccharide export system ATP-binding protein